MTTPDYEGPLAGVIGDESLLQPTPLRLGWLLLGLLGAVALGFLFGLTFPHRRGTNAQPTEAS